MDIKESHRVLELEIGASRIEVDNAYCRLLERWHPDRVTPAGDPAAVAEANRMVQAINEAYQTLIKIAPATGAKPAAAPARSKPVLSPQTFVTAPTDKPAAPRPTSAPPPRAAPPPPTRPPSLPPLPGIPAGPAAAPPPAAPVAPLMPPPLASPQAAAASPQNAPPPLPAALAADKTPETAPSFREKATALYDALFPADTPRRRFGPAVLAAALLFLLLLGKCAYSSWSSGRPTGPDPRKTGIVVVKSNRPDTAVELMSLREKGKDGPVTFHGNGLTATLSGLPPGDYILTAKSEGWPEIQQDVTVEKAHTSEATVHFKSGSLRLDSDPAGATVRRGDAVLGKTPLVIPQLPPGECQLTLEYPSWPMVTFTTAISADVEATGSVRLPHGKLTVESTPAGATVVIGRESYGQTPLFFERIPAGTKKLTLQAKGFPPLQVSVTVEDRGEVKVSRELGSGFPELDPAALLRAVWVPEDPNKLSPGVDSLGIYEPRNGIVKNLHRKRLYENWLRKTYRYSATVKAYLRDSGKVEFEEQPNALSKYHVVAELSPAARNDKDLVARLTKGAKLSVYGPLVAVEEPRWLGVITLEISGAEPLH